MKQPKLEIRKYNGEGYYDYALFRLDRTKPMISGISKAHAEHVKLIYKRSRCLKETITPIKNWFDHDEIIDDEFIDDDGNVIGH